MRHPLLPGLAALALLLVPGRAEAQWSLRLAVEAPLYAHATFNGQSSSVGINESFQPGIDVIGSYFLSSWSVDLEFHRGIAATGTGYSRTLGYLGPGTTLDVTTFPLYARASLPFQLENGFAVFLRVGGGLKIMDLAFIRAYFEVTVDLSLAGTGLSVFGSQAVNAGLGLWLRL
ncbi:MAG TPA: hypothetical protein VLQ79_10610 [Myxococcaceae bacterium]|nr:hypothetical protein [Myxococcaceae bacterium]